MQPATAEGIELLTLRGLEIKSCAGKILYSIANFVTVSVSMQGAVFSQLCREGT